MARVQGSCGGGGGEEIRGIFHVPVNVHPRVRPARASGVPVEAIDVEVIIQPGGVVGVETGKFVGEHWCGVVMRGNFEGYAEWGDAKAGGWWWW